MMNQSKKVLRKLNGKFEKVLLNFFQVLLSLELTLNSHFQILPFINSSKKPGLKNCQNHVQIKGFAKYGCRSDVGFASCAGVCEHPKYLEYIAIFAKKYYKGAGFLNVVSDVSNSIILNVGVAEKSKRVSCILSMGDDHELDICLGNQNFLVD